jgi:hypothetical protein
LEYLPSIDFWLSQPMSHQIDPYNKIAIVWFRRTLGQFTPKIRCVNKADQYLT